MSEEPKVKSLYKALKILESFLYGDAYKGVSDIAKEMGYPKSTVSNILTTYQMLGFLEMEKRSGKYKLGPKALELSNRTYQTNDILKTVQPYIHEIAEFTNEEVLLATRQKNDVVYIGMDCIRGGSVRRFVIGARAPLYCTGIGKAILFSDSDDEIKKLFEGDLIKYTENTITDYHTFLKHLNEQRSRGFSIDNMEHEYGIRCVAVPLRNQDGEIIAGLSVSGPSLRMPDDVLYKYGNRLMEVSNKLSYLLL